MDLPPAPAARLHALVLPFPAQGHISPFLHFSIRLALAGATVTFVLSERAHFHMLKSQAQSDSASPASQLRIEGAEGLDIRFLTIPDGLPFDRNSPLDFTVEIFLKMLDNMGNQQPVLESVLEEHAFEAPPLSCVISDAFFPWTQDLANKLGIPRVLFSSSNATYFFVAYLLATGKLKPAVGNNNRVRECVGMDINCNCTTWSTLEPPLDIGLMSGFPPCPENIRVTLKLFQGISDAACILINSFEELERSVMNTLASSIPVRCVGPSLPASFFTEGPISIEAIAVAGSLVKEEHSCVRWLEKQSESSVLYISMGSVASVSPAQLRHLAFGIEASRQPFLWVIRLDTQARSQLPEGFVDRTKQHGLIVSWAPQLLVLSHPAVGGFLTHCGWNSTLESIVMGIPMLCLPLFADQPLNCELIVKHWKAGFRFQRTEEGIAEKGEVERVVLALMQSEEGKRVKQHVKELRNEARRAIQGGGSSDREIEAFIQDMLGRAIATTLPKQLVVDPV